MTAAAQTAAQLPDFEEELGGWSRDPSLQSLEDERKAPGQDEGQQRSSSKSGSWAAVCAAAVIYSPGQEESMVAIQKCQCRGIGFRGEIFMLL